MLMTRVVWVVCVRSRRSLYVLQLLFRLPECPFCRARLFNMCAPEVFTSRFSFETFSPARFTPPKSRPGRDFRAKSLPKACITQSRNITPTVFPCCCGPKAAVTTASARLPGCQASACYAHDPGRLDGAWPESALLMMTTTALQIARGSILSCQTPQYVHSGCLYVALFL